MDKLNSYLLLGFFSLLIFMPGIAKMPVIDRDEAHFAQASRQMVQTGQYFQIRFQEKTRFQKPPGINWLQAGSVNLFSNAQSTRIWPYRIPSLLGALFSVLLTYFFSRRFVSRRTAGLATALFASALLLVVEAHMAVIDTSLLFSVLLMQGALWVIYQKAIDKQPVHWGWAGCFWLAMAYGLVLKGVTPLVGCLSIATLCIIERRMDWLRGLRIYPGLLLFTLVSLAWVLMVNAAENSNYLLQMIHKDLLPKLQGGHESHGKPPLFHLVILPLTFWPASLFLWQGGTYAVRNRHNKVVKFLLAWLLPTWIFFELMPTKLPQYVLPTFPAIALLCALAIEKTEKIKLPGRWLHFLQILWGVLSIGLAFSLALLPYLVMQQVPVISCILFAGLSGMTIICVYFAWQGAYYRASIAVLISALVAYPLIFTELLPSLEPLWLTKNVAELIDRKQISSAKPLLVVGFEEPSLVFNLNTDLVKFTDSEIAQKALEQDSSRLALIEPALFAKWINNRRSYAIMAHTKGYNYTKGRWVELFLIRQENTGEKQYVAL
ncbi:ArnT family glycosyltransferase [Legionella feeleii]|nr:glycosyltransferase family 39 protein [Legionella feeleii]